MSPARFNRYFVYDETVSQLRSVRYEISVVSFTIAKLPLHRAEFVICSSEQFKKSVNQRLPPPPPPTESVVYIIRARPACLSAGNHANALFCPHKGNVHSIVSLGTHLSATKIKKRKKEESKKRKKSKIKQIWIKLNSLNHTIQYF